MGTRGGNTSFVLGRTLEIEMLRAAKKPRLDCWCSYYASCAWLQACASGQAVHFLIMIQPLNGTPRPRSAVSSASLTQRVGGWGAGSERPPRSGKQNCRLLDALGLFRLLSTPQNAPKVSWNGRETLETPAIWSQESLEGTSAKAG